MVPSRIFAFEPIPCIYKVAILLPDLILSNFLTEPCPFSRPPSCFQVLARNLKGVPGAVARPFALGAASSAAERCVKKSEVLSGLNVCKVQFLYFDDAPGESSRHVTEALHQRALMRGGEASDLGRGGGEAGLDVGERASGNAHRVRDRNGVCHSNGHRVLGEGAVEVGGRRRRAEGEEGGERRESGEKEGSTGGGRKREREGDGGGGGGGGREEGRGGDQESAGEGEE
eukprot:1924921-Rhodomonas_salina.1